MSGRKINTLTIAEKLKLIEEHETTNASAKALAEKFKVGISQVYQTLKNQEKIKAEFLRGLPGRTKRRKTAAYEDVNRAVWKWILRSRANNFPISGKLIQAMALGIAKEMGKTNFKASNGWLDAFKSRHNIVLNQNCVIANDAHVHAVEERIETMSNITKRYSGSDIYSGREFGLFFRLLPLKMLVEKTEKCIAGEMSSERITVFLCANMIGEVETPLVIGTSPCPKDFQNLQLNSLPVYWTSNEKAWMTTNIMKEWLLMFNDKMKIRNRNVVLFLDDKMCHLDISLSNVRLEWFPPDTASYTQPLEGVIANFKYFYRKFQLQSLALKMENCNSIADLCWSINLLDAVYWIKKVKEKILPKTVTKYFKKSGFGDQELTDDELDMTELSELCQRNNLEFDADTLVHFDDDIAAFGDISSAVDVSQDDSQKSGEDEYNLSYKVEVDIKEEPKIKSFLDAISSIEELEKFAAERNCPDLLSVLVDAKDIIAMASSKATRTP